MNFHIMKRMGMTAWKSLSKLGLGGSTRKGLTVGFFVTIFALGIVVLLTPTPKVRAEGQEGQGVPLSGTIYGALDYTFEGTGAWVGHAILALGDKPPVTATFVDRNTSFGMKRNGAVYGTETISVSLTDGSGTFQVMARFDGIPGSTPSLYTLSETGSIANGTGTYAHASGHVTVHGPFLFPDPRITPGTPLWISEIHGVVFGLER